MRYTDCKALKNNKTPSSDGVLSVTASSAVCPLARLAAERTESHQPCAEEDQRSWLGRLPRVLEERVGHAREHCAGVDVDKLFDGQMRGGESVLLGCRALYAVEVGQLKSTTRIASDILDQRRASPRIVCAGKHVRYEVAGRRHVDGVMNIPASRGSAIVKTSDLEDVLTRPAAEDHNDAGGKGAVRIRPRLVLLGARARAGPIANRVNVRARDRHRAAAPQRESAPRQRCPKCFFQTHLIPPSVAVPSVLHSKQQSCLRQK